MIKAAYSLFMEKGYDVVSLDEIIQVSGGSKSSLYKYFGNKEGILKAVVEELANEFLEEIDFPFLPSTSPREALTRIGMVLVDLALSENAINQHRHAAANAKQFPEVGKLWFDAGPTTTMVGIANYLAKEVAVGRLRIANTTLAAHLFAGMIIFHENMRLLVCLPPSKKSELKKQVSEAVEVFLAAYGAEDQS